VGEVLPSLRRRRTFDPPAPPRAQR
jgi:hypothetical protein